MLLFLDIDGVLHPVATRPDQHLVHRPRFEQWAAGHPDTRFVITSSWRQRYPLAVLKGLFSPAISERVIGTTPRLYGMPRHRRYREILAWLEKSDAMGQSWLALDDSSAEFPPECPQLVCCDSGRGFDDQIASELDRRIADLVLSQGNVDRRVTPTEAAPDAVVQQLRGSFEGRRAIYIEKGALHVRVRNIRWDPALSAVFADIEEIPTPGFDATAFHHGRDGSTPLRWDIGTASLTSFSETEWSMDYGGWTIYFAPSVVEGVVDLASRWPKELDEHARYGEVLGFIYGRRAY